MVLDIFFTLFLVLLNGFFVAAEFAIVKVRASQLELKIREGNKLAVLAKNMVTHLDSYLSATQLGITLASLGLGWVGESVVVEIVINIMERLGLEIAEETAHQIAFPIAFAIITVLHIVFGELAPKSLAIQRPQGTTLATAAPLKFFYIIFKPFIWLLNGFANFILRLIGITPGKGHEVHSPQELLYIIEESKEGGAIKYLEHRMLENVLDFYDRPVKEIMLPRVSMTALNIDADKQDLIDTVLKEGFSRYPVYKDSTDHIIGLLFTKDLLQGLYENKDLQLADIIRPAVFVPETKTAGTMLRDMQQNHIQMAIVIDEYGGTSGLVTAEDVLEELVGEIQDEYDNEPAWVEKLNDKEFIIMGRTSILDANEILPIALPVGQDYDTVGGYILELMGKIPVKNETVEERNYKFVMLETNKFRIIKIKVILKNA